MDSMRIILPNENNIMVSDLVALIAGALHPDGIQLLSNKYFNIKPSGECIPLVADEPYMMRFIAKKRIGERIKERFYSEKLKLICPIEKSTVLKSYLDRTNPFDCFISFCEIQKFAAEEYQITVEIKQCAEITPIQSKAEGNDCSSQESDGPKSWLIADPEDPETEQVSCTPTVTIDETMKSDSNNTFSDDGQDDKLATLFDPVSVEVLAKMFPADKQCAADKWKCWQDKASTNGLKEARVGRAIFNPYKAGMWFLSRKIPGWDIDRINRVLAKNLPARSRDEKYQLTGEID